MTAVTQECAITLIWMKMHQILVSRLHSVSPEECSLSDTADEAFTVPVLETLR